MKNILMNPRLMKMGKFDKEDEFLDEDEESDDYEDDE